MPKKVNDEQRGIILRMLATGDDRETIAAAVGVTPGQVSAIAAHVKMGTYQLPIDPRRYESINEDNLPVTALVERETTSNILGLLRSVETKSEPRESHLSSVLLGHDAETEELVYWNPDPSSGSVNPHVLILGESGFGKTYTISCLLAELTRQGIVTVIFDYGQGFTRTSLPPEFFDSVELVEFQASRDGVDINPLQIFPSDILGPVNVAQRVADTFARVYPKIGIQQHAVLRQAVLDAMAAVGIIQDDPETWCRDLPGFRNILVELEEMAADKGNPRGRIAASVASHISTLFVFNTFRTTGFKLSWGEILTARNRSFVIQLQGLEHSLERAVTEFLLWNFIGYVESLGPDRLRCFVVLDEAHKLSCDTGSPVEKLLREGRKFGLGLIMASQQPEDFGPVAFANTSTKLVFQIGDDRSVVSRQLHRKIRNAHSFNDVYQVVTKLPRGWTYVVTENVGRVVKIANYANRTLSVTH